VLLKEEKIMFNHIVKTLLCSVFLLVINGCTNSSALSQGKVDTVSNGVAVVHINKSEKFTENQILNVYRLVPSDSVEEGSDIFDERLIGAIKVESILNEKTVKTKVIKGPVKKNDLVRL
jgi:hypothetical protein